MMTQILFSILLSHKFKSISRSILHKGKKNEFFILNSILIFFVWIPLTNIALAFNDVVAAINLNQETFYTAYVVSAYFYIDLMLRLIFSKSVTIHQAYLTMNISTARLILFHLGDRAVNYFNFTVLIFFIPFALSHILPVYGAVSSLLFIIFITFLSLFSTYLVQFLKIFCLKTFISYLCIYGSFFLILIKGIRSIIFHISESILDHILLLKIEMLFITIIPAGLLILLCFYAVKKELYVDKRKPGKNRRALNQTKISLLSIEFKLLVRNIRTEKNLYGSILLYISIFPLLLFTLIDAEDKFLAFYRLLILSLNSGVYIFGFGIFSVSFYSPFFHFMATRPVTMKRIFLFKYYLYAAGTLLLSCFSAAVFFLLNITQMQLLFTFALWNAFINSLVVLLVSLYNIERYDLSKHAIIDREVWGLKQTFIAGVIFIIPVLLYRTLSSYAGSLHAVRIMIICSLFFLLMHRVFIHLFVKIFEKRKYIILDVFRKDR